jgi:hypothetical protein
MRESAACVAMLTIFLIGISAPEVIGQETSREDFKEWCNAFEGRWVGKVKWVADWPGLGNRGETVTAYLEAKSIEDGHAMIMRFFGGNGSSTLLYAYDSGAKQIRSMWVSSGGGLDATLVYKDNGKWVEEAKGSLVDGRNEKFTCFHAFSDDGKNLTITGSGDVEGKKNEDQHDVWRRVSK